MSDFLKTAFDYKSMQLKCLYRNEDIALVQTGIEDEHLRTVYSAPLKFPVHPQDRPYLYCSLVTSVDGRIAFPDAAEGPFIASKNYLA